jgi:hypothetical protein
MDKMAGVARHVLLAQWRELSDLDKAWVYREMSKDRYGDDSNPPVDALAKDLPARTAAALR